MKYYLFDFDGTLVDSMPTFVGVMLRILDENGIKYESDIVKIITPLGYNDTAKYYQTLGVNRSHKEIVDTMTAYAVKEYTYNVQAKANVIETLKKLKAQGDDLSILTASPHTMLDPCLKRLGIYDLFTNVWSCNDFEMNKSNPQIYVEAAKKIGATVENVIFLDDNFNADKTAKEAGMQVYGVYDDFSKEYVEDIKAITDRYIYDFKELLD